MAKQEFESFTGKLDAPTEFEPFDGTLDGAPPEPAGALSDLGKSLKVGVQKLPGMVTGLADLPIALATGARPFTSAADALGDITGFQPGKWADETQRSDDYKAGQANVNKAWAGVDAVQKDESASKLDYAKKLLADAPEIAGEYLKNPMYTANQVVESVPGMITGGVASKAIRGLGALAGKGISAEAAAAGAMGPVRNAVPGYVERIVGDKWVNPVVAGIGEGAVTAGSAMDSSKGEDQQKNAIAALGAGVGTGLIGIGAGRLANTLGLETSGTAMAKLGDGTLGNGLGATKRILGGAISEGAFQELPQSVQEAMWQNYADGKPIMQGVARQGVEGALAGAVMGAGANVFNSEQPAVTPPGAPPTTPPGQLLTQPPPTPLADTSSPVRATYVEASKDWKAGGKNGDVIRNGDGFQFVANGTPELAAEQARIKSIVDAQTAPPAAEPVAPTPNVGVQVETPVTPQQQAAEATAEAILAAAPVDQTGAPNPGPVTRAALAALANTDIQAALPTTAQELPPGVAPVTQAEPLTTTPVSPTEQAATVEPPKITAREAEIAANKARFEETRAKRKEQTTKAPAGLSYGIGPNTSTYAPITVKNGVIHMGKYPVLDYESEKPVTISDNATHEEIKAAMKQAGAVGKHGRFHIEKDKNAITANGSGLQPLPATGVPNASPVSAGRMGNGTSDGGGSGTDAAPVQSGVVGQSGELPGETPGSTVDVQNTKAPAAGIQAQAAPDQTTEAMAGDAAATADVPGAGSTAVQADGVKAGDFVKLSAGDDQRVRQVESVGDDGWVYTKSGEAFKPGQFEAADKPVAKPAPDSGRSEVGQAYADAQEAVDQFRAGNRGWFSVKRGASTHSGVMLDSAPQEKRDQFNALVKDRDEKLQALQPTQPITGEGVAKPNILKQAKDSFASKPVSQPTESTNEKATQAQPQQTQPEAGPTASIPEPTAVAGVEGAGEGIEEPNFQAAKALLAQQKAATGNAVAEGAIRKKLRDLAAKTPISDAKTVSALDIAATRLGMGEGKLKGLEFAPAAAPVSNTQAEPAKPYRPSKEASSAWNAALERYALRNYHESGPEQRAAFGEGYMRAFDGVGSNPSAKHIAAHVDGVLFYERIAKDAPASAAPAKGLGEQLAELNAELERQGPVQSANTRAQRDSIRKQIASEDFPDILKAVDDNIDVAEELNSAFKYAGDEPKAKTIARILKKRGVTPEYQARWTERLMDGQNDELDAEMRSYEDKAPESKPKANGTSASTAQAATETIAKPAKTKKPAGGKSLRAAAYDRNPLLTFLATHGLFHDKDKPNSHKAEFSPDKAIMVMGYGPVFKKTGKRLDELTQNAIEEGYLPTDGTESQLRELVRRAVAGEKISPLYAEGVAEQIAEQNFAEHLAQQQEAAQNEDFDDPFGPMLDGDFVADDFDVPGYDEASDPIKLEVNALLALADDAGINEDAREAIKEDAHYATLDQSEQAFYEAYRNALKDAIAASNRVGSADSGEASNAQGQREASPPEISGSVSAVQSSQKALEAGQAEIDEAKGLKYKLPYLEDRLKENLDPTDGFDMHILANELPPNRAYNRMMTDHNGDFSGVEFKNKDGRHAFVLPDASQPGKWRVSYFDKDGFSRHESEPTREKAQQSLARDGYTIEDKGALDRLASTKEWARGTDFAGLIFQLNSGAITHAQFIEKQNKLNADYEASKGEGLTLTAPSRQDVLAQQAAIDAEAKRKEEGGDKPIPRKQLTGDIPDLFNPQGSVFDAPAEPEAVVDPISQSVQALADAVKGLQTALAPKVEGKQSFPITAQGAIDAFNADDSTQAVAIMAKLKLDDLKEVGGAIGFRPQNGENAKSFRERIGTVADKLTLTNRKQTSNEMKLHTRLTQLASDYDRAIAHRDRAIANGAEAGSSAFEGQYEGQWTTIDKGLEILENALREEAKSPDYAKVSAMVKDARPAIFDAAKPDNSVKPEARPDSGGILFSRGETQNPTTVSALQSAIKDLLGTFGTNKLGRIVATTAAEIKSTWEPLIGKTNLESEGNAGKAQAFFDPKTNTVFLIADNIEAGTETAVLAHELMHKHGKQILGEAGWNKLHSVISSWADAKEGSQERQVYDQASAAVDRVGVELSSEELFPYAVEAAIKMGIKPNMMTKPGTVTRWLAEVRNALKQVWEKIIGKPDTFKAQDLVNLAFGIAQRENNPELGAINDGMTNPDVVGNQGGRSADDNSPGAAKHPFAGFTREKFLGNPKITSDANARDLVPSTWKSLESVQNVPFAIGDGFTARFSELSAAVYNAKGEVVASYSSGDTLVVNKKYRRQGIGSELVYQWRMKNPNSKTAQSRTKKSQALQEKLWDRIRSERALYEARAHQNEPTAPDSGGALARKVDQTGAEANPDIRFSRTIADTLASAANSTRDVNLPAGYKVGDLFNSVPGKLGWWHKTVGTQYHLAQKSPAFKRVFDSVQRFINDVSFYATEAADLAPNILPKLETWKDITKSPLSSEDTKAISAPIFEGTLIWARDESGKAVKIDAMEADAAKLTPEQKAQRLLRGDHISESVLKMWQGLPVEQFESIIEGKYASSVLKAGIVFTDAELKSIFNLTDEQIPLYREFRKATDKSLSNLAISDMLRFGGKDTAPISDAVLEAKTVGEAAEMLRDYLLSLTDMDPDRADVLTDTANKMIDKGAKAQDLIDRGYAPLSRYGQYTLDVVSADGERVYFGMFESRMDAARMARNMAQEYPDATMTRGTISEEEYKLFAGVSPETLELFGDMLGLEAQGDSASAQAFQTYLKLAKSNRSSMKRLIHRKGIAGFSEDAGRVLAGFVYSNSRQTASNLHMGEMTNAANEVSKTQGELKDQAVRLVDYVKNPREEAQAFRGLLFAQYIGGSVASAMVNMTQPFTMTFPWLSQYGGAGKAAKQMTAAMKDSNKKLTGDTRLDAALKRAEEDGTVSPQEVHQLMQQSQGRGALLSGDGTKAGNALAAGNNFLSRLSLGWGKLFGVAEQFNRRVTFIAAYRTAVEQGMKDPDGFARKAIAETQGIYNKGNKPSWARGALGSVLFTFKQFSVAYVEMLSRMAKAGKPGSKERAQGQKAALLALGVLFLMSGAGGMPGADDLDDLISGLMQRLGYNFDSKLRRKEFFVSMFGEGGAQFIERGVSGLPGVPLDVSGRLGMGNLIPGTGLLTKKTDHTRDVTEIAGPAGDFVKRIFDSAGKLVDGHIGGKDGALAVVSPKAAQNLYQAYDMANMGMYRDAKGMKVLDTDGYDAALKAIGFQPNDVKKVQDASFDSQRMIGLNRLRETEIANQWAQGIFEKDADKVKAARADLAEWNEANPESPIKINFKQILQRVQKMNQTKAQRIAATAPKEIRADVRRALEVQ